MSKLLICIVILLSVLGEGNDKYKQNPWELEQKLWKAVKTTKILPL